MRHTVKRTHLVRRVETWEVDAPDDADLTHWIADHFASFDDDLTQGGSPLEGWTSKQVSVDHDMVDYDELHLEVVDRAPGNVIPIGRGKR
jgi:hypothetical protein